MLQKKHVELKEASFTTYKDSFTTIIDRPINYPIKIVVYITADGMAGTIIVCVSESDKS